MKKILLLIYMMFPVLVMAQGHKIVEIRFDDDKTAYYDYSELDQIEHSYAITIHKAQRK